MRAYLFKCDVGRFSGYGLAYGSYRAKRPAAARDAHVVTRLPVTSLSSYK